MFLHIMTHSQSVWIPSTGDRPIAEAFTYNTQHLQKKIDARDGIQTLYPI